MKENNVVKNIDDFRSALAPFLEARDVAARRLHGLADSVVKLQKEVEEKERKLGRCVSEMSYGLSIGSEIREKALLISRDLKVEIDNLRAIIEQTETIEMPRLKQEFEAAKANLLAQFKLLLQPVKADIFRKISNKFESAFAEGSNFIDEVSGLLQELGLVYGVSYDEIIGMLLFNLKGIKMKPDHRKYFVMEG